MYEYSSKRQSHGRQRWDGFNPNQVVGKQQQSVSAMRCTWLRLHAKTRDRRGACARP